MIPGLARGLIPGSTATVPACCRTSPSPTSPSTWRDPASVVWLDLCRPTAADFDMVDDEFGLHALAVEDALHEPQRPKLDRYATHLFLSAYAVDLDARAPAARRPARSRVFITDQALVTVRKDDGVRHRRAWWPAGTPRPTWPGTASRFLLYGLLDHHRRRPLRRRAALDDGDRGARGPAVRRRAARPGGAAALVRAAQEPGAAAPGGRCRCARSSTR